MMVGWPYLDHGIWQNAGWDQGGYIMLVAENMLKFGQNV